MLNLVFQVVILVKMNQLILANILYLFLVLICLIYKHYVFGDQMIFLGQQVSSFLFQWLIIIRETLNFIFFSALNISFFDFLIIKLLSDLADNEKQDERRGCTVWLWILVDKMIIFEIILQQKWREFFLIINCWFI
jgi:hypothetical protein